MNQKTKKNRSFSYLTSILFFLLIFIIKANAETKIIAKDGDTLLKLSKQYEVPLKELMYKNNFNDASKLIEGEVILIPDKGIDKYKNNKYLTYKVIEGDTLYKIARDYNINLKDIISINNLSNDIDNILNELDTNSNNGGSNNPDDDSFIGTLL